MLTCSEVTRKLGDYLAGKATVELSQQIRWHLGHCSNCKGMLRAARRTVCEQLAVTAELACATRFDDPHALDWATRLQACASPPHFTCAT
jgi:predicted anti-sigma-YlaC factor YlaD